MEEDKKFNAESAGEIPEEKGPIEEISKETEETLSAPIEERAEKPEPLSESEGDKAVNQAISEWSKDMDEALANFDKAAESVCDSLDEISDRMNRLFDKLDEVVGKMDKE